LFGKYAFYFNIIEKKFRMCGIVAVTGYKKALPLLINGLEKLNIEVTILQGLQ